MFSGLKDIPSVDLYINLCSQSISEKLRGYLFPAVLLCQMIGIIIVLFLFILQHDSY